MSRRGSHHSRVGGLRPRRTTFDLSYEKKFTCDFGQLIPVLCDEVVTGDHWRIGYQDVLRMQPMVAPIMHEISVTIHTFFVPYRLLWEQWENFFSGGPDGKFNQPLPRWDPTENYNWLDDGSLYDYFGFPLHFSGGGGSPSMGRMSPMAFPLRAYNLIWEEYYRDENYQVKLGYTDITDYTVMPLTRLDGYNSSYASLTMSGEPLGPYLRNWTKDYFTSALPWQQRGPSVSFPISGTLPVEFYDGGATGPNSRLGVVGINWGPSSSATSGTYIQVENDGTGNQDTHFVGGVPPGPQQNGELVVGPADVNLTDGVSFDVKDLRLIVQLQKWMERNARGGVRYTELLRTHFGVAPTDARLDRPEYIGGTKSRITVSEVLQTSATVGDKLIGDQTPQGTMAGHGLMASGQRAGSYFVREPGLIMGILSIMPTPSYEDGIDRQWLRYVNTDFYWPEFVNLSEQAIYNAEIYSTGLSGSDDSDVTTSEDYQPWGYQPQYDEMRIKRNMVCAGMRINSVVPSNSIAYWHLGRSFSSLPPLGSNFVQLSPVRDNLHRPFAVTDINPFIVSHGNIIRATRPIPYIGEPGLVDHH